MFTFSSGFEAATLKIPNKEYTSYGGIVGSASGTTFTNGLRGPFQSYGAQNDPYNIDGPRDGTVGHPWPTSDDLTSNQAHFLPTGINGLQAGATNPVVSPSTNAMQPRKQIIGFAKFRSRDEALMARDMLQGRRVDIEKGAVLKAEMAKKNLHTKRGVGPVPAVNAVIPPPPVNVGVSGLSGMQTSAVQQQPQLPPHLVGLDSFGSAADFKLRDTGLSRLGWRDTSLSLQTSQQPADLSNTSMVTFSRDDEDRRRESMVTALSGLSFVASTSATTPTLRGARERVEEERRKEMDEKEIHLTRPRGSASAAAAFDAFHSVGVNANAGFPTANTLPNPLSAAIGLTGISRQTSSTGSQGGTTTTNGGSGTSSSAILIPSTPMSAPAESSVSNGSPLIGVEGHPRHQLQKQEELVGPWDKINLAIPSKNGNGISRPRSETHDSTSPMATQACDGSLNSSVGVNGNSIEKDSAQYQHQHPIPQVNGVGMSYTGSSNPSTGNASPTLPSPASHESIVSGGSSNSGGSGFSGSTTGAHGVNMRGTVDQNPPVGLLWILFSCFFFLHFEHSVVVVSV